MAGTAAAVGDSLTVEGGLQYTVDILSGLATLFGKTPVADPAEVIGPAPVSNPDRDSVFQIAGVSGSTLAFVAVGVILALVLLK